MNNEPTLARRAASEAVGTALLLATVVGSGIMAEQLAAGNVAIALLANTIATGAALVALILTFGPISGAHFNPAVTLADATQKGIAWSVVPVYIIAQIVGAFAGVAAANVMFDLPVYFLSDHVRAGGSQLFSEAVFEDMDRRRPDMIFCLGDLVGYAPWPNEVVDMIRARGIPTIAGNYDEGVGLNSGDCGCAYRTDEERARGVESISFTNSVVTGRTRAYLRLLPRHLRVELGTGEDRVVILMVHGSPRKINEYLFEDRPDASFHRMMEEAGADIMLFGHTHKPYHRILKYVVEREPRFRHAINIGSVGKPKDGDARACHVLVHTHDPAGNGRPGTIQVEFVRVAYDVERAATAIEASALPNELRRCCVRRADQLLCNCRPLRNLPG